MRWSLALAALIVSGCADPAAPQDGVAPPPAGNGVDLRSPAGNETALPPLAATGCDALWMGWDWNADDGEPGDLIPSGGSTRLGLPADLVRADASLDIMAEAGATFALNVAQGNRTFSHSFPADGANAKVPWPLGGGDVAVEWSSTGRLSWGLVAMGFTCADAPPEAATFGFGAVVCDGPPAMTLVLDWRLEAAGPDEGAIDFLVPEAPLLSATAWKRQVAVGGWSWAMLDAAGVEVASETAAEADYWYVNALPPGPTSAASVRTLALTSGTHTLEWTFAGVAEGFRLPVYTLHCP